MTPEPESATSRWISGVTLIITNLIKLGGLGVALDQVFFRPSAEPVALALAAFMMAGAQGVEEAALHFVARFFGAPEQPKPPVKRRRTRRTR